MWHILYDRAHSLLPDKEKELLKLSSEIEEINYLDRQSDSLGHSSNEANKRNRESLNAAVSMLNEENLNLKIILQRAESAHRSEINSLKCEIECLKNVHSNDVESKLKYEREKLLEIELLKQKLRQEEEKYSELKTNFNKEINAVKIRFENELSKQNSIMQQKNNELLDEIKTLNAELRSSRLEKTDTLKVLVQKDKLLSEEAVEQKSERKIEIFKSQACAANEVKISVICLES